MIQDPLRLTDGFRGLPDGMNGSRLPPLVDPTSVWYAENVTFRDGVGAHTRPGFKEIPLTYWLDDPDLEDDIQVINGDNTTSRGRFNTFVKGGSYIQGAFLYEDPRAGNPVQILLVIDGYIISVSFASNTCKILNCFNSQGDRRINATSKVYIAQAERFAIIQNNIDIPMVFDGYSVSRSNTFGDHTNVVPIGKQMAYGQGRLFVATENGTKIQASDLIFGGSTTSLNIHKIEAVVAGYLDITTTTAHGLEQDDIVTISGLPVTSLINGSYIVSSIPRDNNQQLSTITFRIQSMYTTSTPGIYGKVAKFNSGLDSDILNFTETLYLNEGGYMSIPTIFGGIVAMNFIPTQDTATGQGNLIVLCSRGAVSFNVGLDRTKWGSTIGFQTVLYSNIGATSDSTALVNGDIFFRSLDGNGIRSYRSARAEFDGYGQTPMSAQVDPVLNQDTPFLLDRVSLVYFNDRLLMTCLPELQVPTAGNNTEASNLAANPGRLVYKGVVALDFRSVATIGGAGKPAYDGVWTGFNFIKLFAGNDSTKKRCFSLCHSETGGYSIWELNEDLEADLGADGYHRIKSSIITKAYTFSEIMALKRLLRLDLWFDSIKGGPTRSLDINVAYKPDDWPEWVTWASYSKTFDTESFNAVAGGTEPYATLYSGYAPQYRLSGDALPQLKFPSPADSSGNTMTNLPMPLGYDFTFLLEWEGHARLGRFLGHALQIIEKVGC